MATKRKAFHCVEMKRQAQAKLHAEYEARKDEFDSYVGFLNWKADHSEFVKSIRQKIASAQADSRRD